MPRVRKCDICEVEFMSYHGIKHVATNVEQKKGNNRMKREIKEDIIKNLIFLMIRYVLYVENLLNLFEKNIAQINVQKRHVQFT